MGEPRDELKAELLAFVCAPDPARFDALALAVVRHQAAAVPPYGRLVAARGGLPDSWRDAPLVPTELFRDLELASGPPGGVVFETSGTTSGRPGRRRVPDLTLYDAAMERPFVDRVLGGDRRPRPWVSLIPPRAEQPASSLCHMVDELLQRLADPATSAVFMGAAGLDAEACAAHLAQLAAAGGPVLVLATSFALVHLLDGAPRLEVRLAPGSRMMLTGGFKGKSRELDETALLAAVEARLGLAPGDVVPEYGMTELTSQAYGRPLVTPPWLRLRVVDPETLSELPPGREGLVACFDLLSLDNVSALLTQDRGVLTPDGGLELRGRATGAPARGCSLTAEQLGLVE